MRENDQVVDSEESSPFDVEGAVPFWRPLAETGDVFAQYHLGLVYLGGGAVKYDDEAERLVRVGAYDAEAAKWFQAAADQGHAEARRTLGWMYNSGHGVPKSSSEAVRWFRLAAEQGDVDAQHSLGHMYHEGEGVPQDDAEARRWYHLADEQGEPGAGIWLAIWQAQQATAEDAKRHWLAAEQGDVDAQYWVGCMYSQGIILPKDYNNALKWFQAAANQGHAEAQYALGNFKDVPEVRLNNAEAARWYRLAAEQGHVYAQTQLGLMYQEGEGVPQDYVLGHMWSNLAASQGGKPARENRDILAGKMTPDQIADAQRLAREWKPAAER